MTEKMNSNEGNHNKKWTYKARIAQNTEPREVTYDFEFFGEEPTVNQLRQAVMEKAGIPDERCNFLYMSKPIHPSDDPLSKIGLENGMCVQVVATRITRPPSHPQISSMGSFVPQPRPGMMVNNNRDLMANLRILRVPPFDNRQRTEELILEAFRQMNMSERIRDNIRFEYENNDIIVRFPSHRDPLVASPAMERAHFVEVIINDLRNFRETATSGGLLEHIEAILNGEDVSLSLDEVADLAATFERQPEVKRITADNRENYEEPERSARFLEVRPTNGDNVYTFRHSLDCDIASLVGRIMAEISAIQPIFEIYQRAVTISRNFPSPIVENSNAALLTVFLEHVQRALHRISHATHHLSDMNIDLADQLPRRAYPQIEEGLRLNPHAQGSIRITLVDPPTAGISSNNLADIHPTAFLHNPYANYDVQLIPPNHQPVYTLNPNAMIMQQQAVLVVQAEIREPRDNVQRQVATQVITAPPTHEIEGEERQEVIRTLSDIIAEGFNRHPEQVQAEFDTWRSDQNYNRGPIRTTPEQQEFLRIIQDASTAISTGNTEGVNFERAFRAFRELSITDVLEDLAIYMRLIRDQEQEIRSRVQNQNEIPNQPPIQSQTVVPNQLQGPAENSSPPEMQWDPSSPFPTQPPVIPLQEDILAGTPWTLDEEGMPFPRGAIRTGEYTEDGTPIVQMPNCPHQHHNPLPSFMQPEEQGHSHEHGHGHSHGHFHSHSHGHAHSHSHSHEPPASRTWIWSRSRNGPAPPPCPQHPNQPSQPDNLPPRTRRSSGRTWLSRNLLGNRDRNDRTGERTSSIGEAARRILGQGLPSGLSREERERRAAARQQAYDAQVMGIDLASVNEQMETLSRHMDRTSARLDAVQQRAIAMQQVHELRRAHREAANPLLSNFPRSQAVISLRPDNMEETIREQLTLGTAGQQNEPTLLLIDPFMPCRSRHTGNYRRIVRGPNAYYQEIVGDRVPRRSPNRDYPPDYQSPFQGTQGEFLIQGDSATAQFQRLMQITARSIFGAMHESDVEMLARSSHQIYGTERDLQLFAGGLANEISRAQGILGPDQTAPIVHAPPGWTPNMPVALGPFHVSGQIEMPQNVIQHISRINRPSEPLRIRSDTSGTTITMANSGTRIAVNRDNAAPSTSREPTRSVATTNSERNKRKASTSDEASNSISSASSIYNSSSSTVSEIDNDEEKETPPRLPIRVEMSTQTIIRPAFTREHQEVITADVAIRPPTSTEFSQAYLMSHPEHVRKETQRKAKEEKKKTRTFIPTDKPSSSKKDN